MKYTHIIITFILLLCFTFVKYSKAQFIKAVLPIGANFTQVDGDAIAGYNKISLQAGVGAMIDLNELETWEVGFEILYNRLGSRSNSAQAQSIIDIKLQYDYVSIPLLVNYKDVGDGYLGAGLIVSRLVNNNYFENGNEMPDPSTKVKSMDLSIMGQAGFVFSPNFRVTLRVGYSMFPFLEPRAFHNYVSLRFDTILNGLIKR